jgi:hypothetical protein
MCVVAHVDGVRHRRRSLPALCDGTRVQERRVQLRQFVHDGLLHLDWRLRDAD